MQTIPEQIQMSVNESRLFKMNDYYQGVNLTFSIDGEYPNINLTKTLDIQSEFNI